MKRRDLLAGATTVAVAGCLASAPGDDAPETGTPSPQRSPTDTATPTAAVADARFEVTDVGPGDGEGGAAVTFGDEIVVEGRIVGRNGCYTAGLADAAVADGTLTVVVEAYEQEGAEMCTQALVDVAYSARFSIAGRRLDRVVVEHDRGDAVETVADATRTEA